MRKLSFLVLILMLAMTGVASAQDGMMGGHGEFCGDLSEEDCDLYTELQQGQVPDSAAFESVTDISLTADGSTFDMSITMGGSYVYDVEVVRAYLDSISDVSLLDVTPDTFIGFIESGITAFNADLSLEIDLPAPIAFMSPVNPVELDLWLVDGVAYADLTPLSMIAEDESLAGVYGINGFEIIRLALSEVTLGDLMSKMDGDMSMDDGGMMRDGDFGFKNNFMPPMLNPDEVDFVAVTRLEDSEVDGEAVAVFETVVDIPAIYENPTIRGSLSNYLPPEADFDPDALGDALQEGLAGSTMTIVEMYSIDSGYLLESTLNADFTIDPAPFMALEGDLGDDAEVPEPFVFTMESTLSRSDINAVESIDLPEGAEVVPAEALMGMAMGGM